jgi:hypothetical protein
MADWMVNCGLTPKPLLALFGRNRSITVAEDDWVMLATPLDVIDEMFADTTSTFPVGIIEAVIAEFAVASYSTNISLTVNGFEWKYSDKVTVPLGLLLDVDAVEL